MPFNIKHLWHTLRPLLSTYPLLLSAILIHQNTLIYSLIPTQQQTTPLIILGLQIWHYILIIFLLVQLVQIYKTDTRDPLLIQTQKEEQFQAEDLVFCVMCNQLVLKTSYHCWKCTRCINLLDHHCQYLNCCIADNNYVAFLRLITIFIMYSLNYCFLILTITSSNITTQHQISLLLTSSQLILAISLLIFHIYLNCIVRERTYEFVERVRGINRQRVQYNKPAIQYIEQSYSHS